MAVERIKTQEELLDEAAERTRHKQEQLLAEMGLTDPNEAIDRIAESVAGDPRVAQELLRIVLENIYGEGFDEEPSEDE